MLGCARAGTPGIRRRMGSLPIDPRRNDLPSPSLLLPSLGPAGALLVTQPLAVLAIAVSEHLLPYRRRSGTARTATSRTDVIHAVVSGVGTTQVVRPLAQAAGVARGGRAVAGGRAAAVAGRPGRSSRSSPWRSSSSSCSSTGCIAGSTSTNGCGASTPSITARRASTGSTRRASTRSTWACSTPSATCRSSLLGCPESVIMLFALFDAVFGMLQHCNIDVRLGPLNRIFSMAEPHRWHHSRVLARGEHQLRLEPHHLGRRLRHLLSAASTARLRSRSASPACRTFRARTSRSSPRRFAGARWWASHASPPASGQGYPALERRG